MIIAPSRIYISVVCANNIRLNFAFRENSHFRRYIFVTAGREQNRFFFRFNKSTDFYVPHLLFVPSNIMAVGGGIKRAHED